MNSKIARFMILVGFITHNAKAAEVKIDLAYVKQIMESSYNQTKQTLEALSADEAEKIIAKIDADTHNFALETCLRIAYNHEQADACIMNMGKMYAMSEYRSHENATIRPINNNWDMRAKLALKAIEMDSFFKEATNDFNKKN